jgi:uncharacterized protein (TIGR03084 family)
MMLPQIADLDAEAGELHRLLADLPAPDWDRATQFKGWTVNDILQHLHVGDAMSLAAATDVAAFDALLADIRAKRAQGLSRVEENRQRLGGLTGRRLLERWRATLDRLRDALAAKGPGERIPWVGPDMGVGTFATARQMEIWAHGQAIYDLFGRERPAARARLRNIAELGVRTFGWTYRNRNLPVPPERPYIRLDAPAGETWEWNEPSRDDAVTGAAVAFCQVVTQVRHVSDTGLLVTGDTARHWMSIAQCFAGPPENPPAAGTRYKAAERR